MSVVIGLDMGGTATRAVVVDLHGRRLGSGQAGGGNPVSHPPEQAAAAMREAVRDALRGLDPGRVALGFAGMAGCSRLAEPAVRAEFDRAWRQAGPCCPLDVVADTDVAFSAATAEPDGTILIAGTGTVAGQVRDRALVRFVGGHGWLLGDHGGGFWLGRQAVLALLAALDGRTEPGPLTDQVWRALLPEPPEHHSGAEAVIAAVDHDNPIQLARLAPLVAAAAETGDPAARRIVRRAAGHLTDLVAAVRGDDETGPVVLAGSVIAPGTPVHRLVAQELTERWHAPVLTPRDGAAGAAWLALRRVLAGGGRPTETDLVALHRIVVGPTDPQR